MYANSCVGTKYLERSEFDENPALAGMIDADIVLSSVVKKVG